MLECFLRVPTVKESNNKKDREFRTSTFLPEKSTRRNWLPSVP
jgi:hypothetical protein